MKDEVSYARSLAASLAWHLGILFLLLGISVWRGCVDRRRPREIATLVELRMETPPVRPDPSPVAPAPPPPEPESRPAPVQRSERRIVRPARTAPSAPALTEEEIRRRLLESVSRPTPAPPRSSSNSALSGYFLLVRQALYDAWVQPSELSVPAGRRPIVRIRVQRDGTVLRRELIRPSGNKRMDASALAAAQKVRRLPPFPATYREAYRDIDIEFELSR